MYAPSLLGAGQAKLPFLQLLFDRRGRIKRLDDGTDYAKAELRNEDCSERLLDAGRVAVVAAARTREGVVERDAAGRTSRLIWGH